MSDKSSSVRQYSTIGCFLLLICFAVVFIVWMSWRILHAPAPPKPIDDSMHRLDSIRKKDSVTKADSLAKIQINKHKSDFLQPEFDDTLFSFRITYDSSKNYTGDWWYTIARVDIFTDPEQHKVQSVYPGDIENYYRYSEDQFIPEDMNFDGYTDFRIKAGAYVNGCATYVCWLYDAAKKKFIENGELESTFDPEFDPKEKLVYSWKNETYSPFDETRECFSWKDGKLYLEHSEVCFSDPAGSMSTLTMTKRVGTKLVSRSKDYKDAPIDSTGQLIYNWDEMK